MKVRVTSVWMYLLVFIAIMLVVMQVQIFQLNQKLGGGGLITKSATSAVEPKVSAGAPKIDFYVMSYCPYGNQAEEGIAPVYELLKGKAEFNPHYVVYSNYQGGGPNYCIDAASKYCSMHGVQEMNQNIREACVDDLYGVGAWFKFALAMNKACTAGNADACWEAVAKGLGYDTAKIANCQTTKGEEYAAADLALNQQLGVQGSPTIFINGKSYNGGRAPGDYLAAICLEFGTNKPAECSQVLQTTAAAAAGGCG